VTIRRLNFQNPQHVQFFKSLPVEEKRLYVGHYIDLGDLVRFTQALLHFRQRFPNIETTQQYIKYKKPLDAVEFIPSDYTSQFSGRGEMLLELAVRKDAELYNFDSQAILKKVLDDIVILKRQKKQVTVIPKGVALGYTIVEHAGEAYTRNSVSDEERQDIRRNVLNFLLTHPATEKFKKQILHTHHHLDGNLHRLNVYTEVVKGNTSIANLMKNLRITKNTANPINVFKVEFNKTARITPPRPTHNGNPQGLETEQQGQARRVYVSNNVRSTLSNASGPVVNTPQVNKPVPMNESNGPNKVKQYVNLINLAFNHANTLARNMSNDLNSVEARRSYKYGFNLAQTIIKGNKLPQNDITRIIQKGNITKQKIEAKEATLKREGKRLKTNGQGPSTSNLSSQSRR
jgi:hypothetical protein